MEGLKWDGSFSKDFLSRDGFFNRGLTIAVFRSRCTMPVVRDVLMMFVMVGITYAYQTIFLHPYSRKLK